MAIQALILAAGRGSRLGSRTSDVPKPLLQIGPKRLIEHQLEMLANAGVGPVATVVGYQSDEIVDVVGSQVDYIYNHKWSTTNSAVSFLAARDWVKDDLVLLNCDLLLHPQILDQLLASGFDSFAFDSTSGNGREHMKVALQGSRLLHMSKTLPQNEVAGENVGVLYFSKDAVARLFEIASARVSDGHVNDWVGSAVEELAQERPLHAVDIAGLPWAEIDFEYDLVRARKEVWPRIRERNKFRLRRGATIFALITAVLMLLGQLQKGNSIPPIDQQDWDTVILVGSSKVSLEKGGSSQAWWLVPSGESASFNISGPDTIRIESRLLIPDTSSESSPYIIGISIDGRLTDWGYYVPDKSRTAFFVNRPVGKRMRKVIPVPEGDHRIEISATSTGPFGCLVRVRKLEDANQFED